MRLSIVSSVYRTAAFLDRFHAECQAALDALGVADYEIILTIDGSPDDWRPTAERLKERDPRVRVIELSRNFGHHAALWCGLEHARGDLVFLIDSDLEVAPAVLIEFAAALAADPDLDVVYACQARRGGKRESAILGRGFWAAFRLLSPVEVPANVLTERLMRRGYVDALLRLGDRNLFLAGMMHWAGFRQLGVVTAKRTREGPASYSLARRLALAIDAVTSFSDRPMHFLFAFGVLVAGGSFLAALWLVGLKLFDPGYVVHGYASIAVLILFSLGVTTGSIGLIGIYIGKIFVQTRGRPIYVVKREL
jgi:putative glycosyltransferase